MTYYTAVYTLLLLVAAVSPHVFNTYNTTVTRQQWAYCSSFWKF